MRIAIIGWGSLIWDPRDLPREGIWQAGGPKLPIEFSRVSKDCRLTLVIDEKGVEVPTQFVLSPRTSLDDALNDLASREGTHRAKIGFVDLLNNESSHRKYPEQVDVSVQLTKWCKKKRFDAALWTALVPNFKEQTGRDFDVDNAVAYLKGLPKGARKNALKYIDCAPEEVETRLRTKLRVPGIMQ